MKYLEALLMSRCGFWIKSKQSGNVYLPEVVGAYMIGLHAASTNNYGVTDAEIKGSWMWCPQNDKYRTDIYNKEAKNEH